MALCTFFDCILATRTAADANVVDAAQLGDYSGSMLYRLGKRGHRFKCWECGVKKKAPCGDTHRADLPWCCHRRLGAHVSVLDACFRQRSVTLKGASALICMCPASTHCQSKILKAHHHEVWCYSGRLKLLRHVSSTILTSAQPV